MNLSEIKIVFMGTPNFAVPTLIKLMEAKYNIVGVITQPDKPVGRQQTLTPPPVKVLAEKNNLPIYQFDKINPATVEEIKSLKPDLIIVGAYGKILPPALLVIPQRGCLNIHPSLLPKYRGASPIQTAILNGDDKTGVSIIELDEELDHGPIIAQEVFEILNDDTYESLSDNLACEGAEMLINILPDYLAGRLTGREQNHSEVTKTKILTKEDGRIDWKNSAESIDCQIRAFYPWPGAWCEVEEKKVKISKAHLKSEQLVINKIQPAGKEPMEYEDYLNGNKPLV